MWVMFTIGYVRGQCNLQTLLNSENRTSLKIASKFVQIAAVCHFTTASTKLYSYLTINN